ncbi:hypothetical protein LCGC14_2196990 [marine sediment metagenome]|uniref:Uncharacterized protein n=1 Tax=marine sediment metagenome TaxID=412755 RepID=A0A0F9GDQ2_9ZZZZ
MPDHLAGELALAALRALPTPKLKEIWNTLHRRIHDPKAHPEPGDYDVMDNIRKVLRDREGPELQSGREMVVEAMRDMFTNGVD